MSGGSGGRSGGGGGRSGGNSGGGPGPSLESEVNFPDNFLDKRYQTCDGEIVFILLFAFHIRLHEPERRIKV